MKGVCCVLEGTVEYLIFLGSEGIMQVSALSRFWACTMYTISSSTLYSHPILQPCSLQPYSILSISYTWISIQSIFLHRSLFASASLLLTFSFLLYAFGTSF